MRFSKLQATMVDSESRRLLDFALNNVNDAVYLVDSETCFFYVNDQSCRMLGFSSEELLKMSVSDIDQQWSKEAICSMWKQERENDTGKAFSFETQHKTKSGALIPVEVCLNSFFYEGVNYNMCVVRDIRERQHLAQLICTRDQEFRVLVENSPDLIARFDPKQNCLYANPTALHHLSVSAEQLRGKRLRELLGDLNCVRHIELLLEEVLASQREAAGELLETDNASLQGTVIHYIRCVPEFDRHGVLVSLLVIGRDITAIRYAEKKLEDSHMRLRLLSRQREVSREEERKHIAREIHDELGQHLTSLRMGISMLRIQFGKNDPQLHERVLHLMGLADKTIQVVRNVATRLRPNVLDLGLAPALEWLRDEFINRHSGCCCRLIIPEKEIRLNDEQATAAFRVVQESLTNITRHAQASKVTIILERKAEAVIITVSDNGKGFDSRQRNDNAFGLMSMKERGRMLGGSVEIDSKPTIGTRVSLSIPFKQTIDQMEERK